MNSTLMQQHSPSRWYREPYVWLVILFPTLSVIMGITILTLSIKSNDGMVVDDYYKRGMAINEILARDQAARDYGLEAVLDWHSTPGQLRMVLSSTEPFDYPETIHIDFFHATRSGYDRDVYLQREVDNLYVGTMPDLRLGRWNVEIEADDWRIMKSHWVE
jgi:uncharacterized protein